MWQLASAETTGGAMVGHAVPFKLLLALVVSHDRIDANRLASLVVLFRLLIAAVCGGFIVRRQISALRRVRLCNRLHLVVDSTDSLIVGEGEWAAAKHGGRGTRGWKSSISASIGQATLLPCLDRRDG